MSRGLWLWEAPSVVFYEVWRPQEVQPLTKLRDRVGPSKEPKILGLGTLEIEAWSFGGLEVTNVSNIVVVGGSICRVLRGLEAPGGPASNDAVAGGGSA